MFRIAGVAGWRIVIILTLITMSIIIIITITIAIYFINPSRKLKLSFDRTTKNIIILNHEPHAHTHS